MRKQIKALMLAGTTIAVGASITTVSLVVYAHSDASRGETIDQMGYQDLNFKEYEMNFIDQSQGQDQVVAQFIPNFNPDVEGMVKTANGQMFWSDYVKKFRQEHDNQEPLLRITKGFFKMNDKYLDAVSPDDWAKFVLWYLGYFKDDGTQVPGHLAYGPEAGSISTYEIVPGVDDSSGAVILGGRTSTNNEVDTIRFYPDAFFGTFSLYSLSSQDYFNRLLEPMFPSFVADENGAHLPMEFTLAEAREVLELINKVNQYNQTYLSASSNISPAILNYWNTHGQTQAFTFNGANAPAPFLLKKSSIKNVDGQSVQYYTFYGEIFTRNTANGMQDSLVRRITELYPSILVPQNDHYIQLDKTTGKYLIKSGLHMGLPFGKRIGMAYILKAIAGDHFKGFGVDFLKYVSLHEYGHHLTLSQAQDVSEGGVNVGGSDGRSAHNANTAFNFQILRNYLAARGKNLDATLTDHVFDPLKLDNGNDQLYQSPYWQFVMNHHNEDQEWLWPEADKKQFSRAYHHSLNSMREDYQVGGASIYNHVASNNQVTWQTSLYNAYIQNAFDLFSGTLNPGSQIGPFLVGRSRPLTSMGIELQNHLIQSIFNGALNFNVSDYFQTQVGNIIASSYRPYQQWSAAEKNSLRTFLNFVMRQATDFSDPYGNENDWDFFLHFYSTQEFMDSWLTPGTAQDQYLDYLRTNGVPLEHLSSEKYAITYGQVDGEWGQYEGHGDISFLTTSVDNQGLSQTTWSDLTAAVLQWQDGQNHPLLQVPSDVDHPDYQFDSVANFNDWNTYDNFNVDNVNQLNVAFDFATPLEQIRDSHNNPLDSTEQYRAYLREHDLDASTLTPAEKAAALKAVFSQKLDDIFATLAQISWSINSAAPDREGKYPVKINLKQIFADYVYQYPEVMTRDFVQSTFWNTDEKPLANTDPFLSLTSGQTSFEYFVSGDLTSQLRTQDDNGDPLSENFLSFDDANMWIKPIAQGLRANEANMPLLSPLEKEIIRAMDQNIYASGFWASQWNLEPHNLIFGHNQMISNGFEQDHAQRRMLHGGSSGDTSQTGWELYDDQGQPIAIKNAQGLDVVDQHGQLINGATDEQDDWEQNIWLNYFDQHGQLQRRKAHTRAEAYWFFILNEYGIGDRTFSGYWRDKDQDRMHFYGYLPERYADDVAYLKFTNEQTNQVTFLPIIKDDILHNQQVENLFYLQRQGVVESAHRLSDEGYIGWTTDRATVGLYLNSDLEVGNYDVTFVDQNYHDLTDQEGHNLFSMGLLSDDITANGAPVGALHPGARHYIAENRKYFGSAPTYFVNEQDNDDFRVTFVVKPQFN